MKPMRAFEPHIDRYHKSILMSSIGMALGAVAWVCQAPVIGGVVGLVVAHQAWRVYKDGAKRHHGIDIEAEHIRNLEKECRARGWTLDGTIWIDGVGNLDVVISAGVARVIVEIKSYWGLRELPDGTVVRCNKGARSAADEVEQVRSQMRMYGDAFNIPKPMGALWCPDAKHGTARETGAGVALVNGDVGTLCDFIARLAKVQTDAFMASPVFHEAPRGVNALNAQRTAFDTLRVRSIS